MALLDDNIGTITNLDGYPIGRSLAAACSFTTPAAGGKDKSLESLMKPDEIEELIERVRQGFASVRYVAKILGCTVDDVCLAAFGEIVL